MFPTKILLATDGSEGAAGAARTAVELSERLDSPLHLVYVEPLSGYYPVVAPTLYYPGHLLPEAREDAEAEAEKRLDEEAMKVGGLGEVSGAHARVGLPHAEIVRAAEEIGAGLIVLGSRGLGGVRRALLGSTSEGVVRHAHCPVLVVRYGFVDTPWRRILAAVDGSEEADAAAGIAAEISGVMGSELHTVFCLPTEPVAPFPLTDEEWKAQNERARHEARLFVDRKADALEATGFGVKDAHLALGEPRKEIVKLGEELEAGLIVVGSRGLGGLNRALMGSVSDAVVRHAHCPVLVVRRGDPARGLAPETSEATKDSGAVPEAGGR